MKITSVDQFIPSLVRRDAVGSHSLEVQSVLREMGYRSELYVGNASGDIGRRTRPFASYKGGEGCVALYQASTGSAIAELLRDRPEPLLLSYHNITPSHHWERWEPAVAQELDIAREQLASLAARCSHAIADSAYNEAELIEVGYRSTSVAGPLVDPMAGAESEDPLVSDWLSSWRRRGGPVVLFVGRLAPNKAQHDLVKAFALYRAHYEPRARLCIVGSAASPRYAEAVTDFVGRLGLSDVVDLPGGVSGEELLSYYNNADVFVCLSEHEGYCVPLIEAMHHCVPVIAYRSSAVGETVGGGGLLLTHKDAPRVAAAIHRVVSDSGLSKALVEAGQVRARQLSLAENRRKFRSQLQQALSRIEETA